MGASRIRRICGVDIWSRAVGFAERGKNRAGGTGDHRGFELSAVWCGGARVQFRLARERRDLRISFCRTIKPRV
jgi:hypothetical protein